MGHPTMGDAGRAEYHNSLGVGSECGLLPIGGQAAIAGQGEDDALGAAFDGCGEQIGVAAGGDVKDVDAR